MLWSTPNATGSPQLFLVCSQNKAENNDDGSAGGRSAAAIAERHKVSGVKPHC